MDPAPYELLHTPDGVVARVRVRGSAVLAIPTLNRGTAFTAAEREALGLTGLLPTAVTTIDGQLRRVYEQYARQPDDLFRYVYLTTLRDRNEVLFYRLLADHIAEMLPIVYTPTIGRAIQRFSHDYRRPRGLYLSVDHPEDVDTAFDNVGMGPDEVDLIVATDGERILGIGDWGVGGVQISIGKLSVYTAAGGIHPRRTLPVVLDVGTDNLELLDDELYLGNRHARVRDERYDALLDAFVDAAAKRFPHALLHWEDFGISNARRLLDRYRDTHCTFNDDLQGTAAVVLAAIIAAVQTAGGRLRDQRVVILGAGTAGLGVADMVRDAMVRDGLPRDQATAKFWAVDRNGLLTDAMTDLRDFQVPYARPAAEVVGWSGGAPGLAEVVAHVHPTILVGTSTVGGAFTEAVVASMAAHVERPVILPLSNPTEKAEAVPADLLAWTDGRALVATGSPFDPVEHGELSYEIAQCNNAFVFPGLGLGVKIARASRVTDGMLVAAAHAVAGLSDARAPGAALLPPVEKLRVVSAAVGVAVAYAAQSDGVAQRPVDEPIQRVHEAMWRPRYPQVEAV